MTEQGLLARLRGAERDALEALCRRRRFPAGQVLFSEGDDGRDVFIVTDGIVKLVTTSASGQQVILDLEVGGSLLGELTAIDGGPRSASAVAVTSIEVLVLGVEQFRDFLEHEPRVAWELLQIVAARLRASSRRQLEFGASDALTRLCRCILGMIERFGEAADLPQVTLPLAQHDIASLTGLSREAVVKGLRRLRELGWVEASGRNIVVRDLGAVQARAGT